MNILKKVITTLFVVCGVLIMFVAICACENGNLSPLDCAKDSTFGLAIIGTGILEYLYFTLCEDYKDLSRENDLLQTRNIALLNRLLEAEKRTKRKPICYKTAVHTPLTPEEYGNRCTVPQCKHNDNGFCKNYNAEYKDGICISMEE